MVKHGFQLLDLGKSWVLKEIRSQIRLSCLQGTLGIPPLFSLKKLKNKETFTLESLRLRRTKYLKGAMKQMKVSPWALGVKHS
jgi:hypothetical protein